LSDFAKMLDKTATRPTWLFARIILAVINEAALTADSIALPRDVDLTMELASTIHKDRWDSPIL